MHMSCQHTDNIITVAATAQCTSWLNAQRLNCNPDVRIRCETQVVLVTDHLRFLIKEKAALAARHFPVLKHIKHLCTQTGIKFQSLNILPMVVLFLFKCIMVYRTLVFTSFMPYVTQLCKGDKGCSRVQHGDHNQPHASILQ